MPTLEYAITRPYPWKWTTITVAFGAGLILVGLGCLNFAAVGYNRQAAYRDDFEWSSAVGWKNKFNTGYTQSESIQCDPSSLATGGVYRTNNAIFALNAESLRDPLTTAPLGSANYSGDALDSCRVNRIYMMAEFATHEARYRAQVACRTPSTLFANFTVDSVVTLRSGVPNSIINTDTLGSLTDEQSRPEAIATSILYALGLDVLASLFIFAPPVQSTASTTNASASSLWAEWDPLATSSDLPLVLSGMAAPDGAYVQSSNDDSFKDLTPTARRAIQNYAIILHSAILVDLGSTYSTDSNILTNPGALQSRIKTDDLLETYQTPTNGSANGVSFTTPAAPFVLANATAFRLPIRARDQSPPARLVQRYLCHSLVLKPTPALVVDVLVATVSMFMVAWGVAQIALMYVAKEHTTNGNYCSCPACDTYTHRLFPVAPGSPMMHTPNDKGLAPMQAEIGWAR